MSARHEAIARKRWPAVRRAMDEAGPVDVALVDHGGRQTLKLDGVHVTSAVDRAAEAALQCERVAGDAPEVTVYGFALGDIPRHLLDRTELRCLTVVVLNPGLARESLQRFDHGWLEDPRVTLTLGADSAVQRPFTAAPACLWLASDGAAALRDRIQLELAGPYQARKYAEREDGLQQSMRDNVAIVEADPDVASLFNTRRDAMAVVAAGGPTLSDSFDWLRETREACLLIAVSTALLPLQRARITPDLAVAVDPKPGLLAHFEQLDDDALGDTPLVYVPAVHPSVLARWPGPRACAYLDQPRYEELKGRLPRGQLFCSGTVTHTAVDLAVKMGANKVVMLGADFCYARGQSHVQGAAHEKKPPAIAHCRVRDGRGEQIPSELNLIGYLRDLEGYIAEHPGVRFFTRSLEGACIAGAEHMP